MTHETLTSCFIHVLTPLVPVVHASPSMLKRLVIFPLLCPFLAVFKLFFSVPVCLSVCLCLCDVCSGPPPDTPLVASGEEFNLWPFLLEFWPVGLLQGGPQRAGLMSFFYLYLFVSVSCVCLRDGGCLSGPPCSSSPHGTIWKGSEVTDSSFFRVLCLSGWITSQSFWPCCCPATSLHGCMHVAPLTGAMLVSLLCLSIETESTQLRRRENSVKMWKRAFPYLKCPGITLAAENLY